MFLWTFLSHFMGNIVFSKHLTFWDFTGDSTQLFTLPNSFFIHFQ
jgi:hypothetical protein